MDRRPYWALVLTALICSFGVLSCNNQKEKTLRIGAIPDQNPERLNRLYGLLSSELSKELNVPVRYKAVTNYPAAVSAFRTDSLDLVWFGGLTGVQARLQTPGAQVIAQRDIDAKFRSVFIANTKSGITTLKSLSGLQQLSGKRFTFGSESSTSGRLMPQHFLQQAGVEINDFHGGRAGFSGSHDATIALVQSGSYDAGALNESVWETAQKNGRVDPAKVKVIWRTQPYADYHWLAQPNLDKKFGNGFTDKLKSTLTGLKKSSKSQGRILELFGADSFVDADKNQYITIELIGRQLGKIQ